MNANTEPCFRVKLTDSLHLCLSDGTAQSARGTLEQFPSSTLQKGLLMSWITPHGEPRAQSLSRGMLPQSTEDLSQEGVGFGVPVLKRGLQSIFAGSMRIVSLDQEKGRISVEYGMNLVDRLMHAQSQWVMTGFLNGLKEMAAALHRGLPFARRVLAGISNIVRAKAGIRTVFVPSTSAGKIHVDMTIGARASALPPNHAAPRALPARISVCVDASGLDLQGLTQIVIMNEQGADHFCRYVDSDGVMEEAAQIGTWSRVSATQASFVDPRHGVGFVVKNLPGAELFKGREREQGRLAWAGFGYVLPPDTRRFQYDIDMCAAPLSCGEPMTDAVPRRPSS